MVDKDFGFIINRWNFRESSVMATIYTKKFGKINGIFKGFYTRKKEFTSTLDICTLNEFVLYPKISQIWLISYADLIKDYSFLRDNFYKSIVASIFIRVINKGTLFFDSNENVFWLLDRSLDSLSNNDEKRVLYIFLIKFLTISGIKPEINLCIDCHSPYGEKFFFSTVSGGLFCEKCSKRKSSLYPISIETSSTISYIQREDFPLVLRINPTPGCENEIIFVLEEFLRYHLNIVPFSPLVDKLCLIG
ncbi:MAG: DNA repair protein RecO [Candidatus Omnitrophica bacterium]|nr:DNA repair protein RecO [Candidatus Omnitrophota bacterium]